MYEKLNASPIPKLIPTPPLIFLLPMATAIIVSISEEKGKAILLCFSIL